MLRLCHAGGGAHGASNWWGDVSGVKIWEGLGFRVDGFRFTGWESGLGLRVSESSGSAGLPDKARSLGSAHAMSAWLSTALLSAVWCILASSKDKPASGTSSSGTATWSTAPFVREPSAGEGSAAGSGALAGGVMEAGWGVLAGGGTRFEGLSGRLEGALLATCTCALVVGVKS